MIRFKMSVILVVCTFFAFWLPRQCILAKEVSGGAMLVQANNPNPERIPSLSVWRQGKAALVRCDFPDLPDFTCDAWCYECPVDLENAVNLQKGQIELRHVSREYPQVTIVTRIMPEPGAVEFRAQCVLNANESAAWPNELPLLNLCWQLKRAPAFASKPDPYPEFMQRCFMFTESGLTFLDKTLRLDVPRFSRDHPRNNPPWTQRYVSIELAASAHEPQVSSAFSPDPYVLPVMGVVSRDGKHLAAAASGCAPEISQVWLDCIHLKAQWLPKNAAPVERVWRKKIYVMENDPVALLTRVKNDFPTCDVTPTLLSSLAKKARRGTASNSANRVGDQTQRSDTAASGYSADLGNGIAMELVWIEGGTFGMGSLVTEPGRDRDEGPLHRVTLDGFWMGKFEVANGQYLHFQRESGYNGSADADSDYLEHIKGNSVMPTGHDHPVTWTTWKNAVAFCDWLSTKTGHAYSLPTEAQWEYACRAGSSTRFSFGNSVADLAKHAWYGANSAHRPQPVGRKLPNDFGLYDMQGNVWEMCLDWYSDSYYSTSPSHNPPGPDHGAYRVFRGGSWYSKGDYCRSANRVFDEPGNAHEYFGFRVVRIPFDRKSAANIKAR